RRRTRWENRPEVYCAAASAVYRELDIESGPDTTCTTGLPEKAPCARRPCRAPTRQGLPTSCCAIARVITRPRPGRGVRDARQLRPATPRSAARPAAFARPG